MQNGQVNEFFCLSKRTNTVSRNAILIPVSKGYCFRFVCLSVYLSVRDALFSFCARNSSYSFYHTQTKPKPSESWVCGVWCVSGECAIPIPHDSPASVVYHDVLSLSLCQILWSTMTSENVFGDASQGKFWRKRLSQILGFF